MLPKKPFLPHCVYNIADNRLECKSPGEKTVLKREEEPERGRLIYVSQFSNQIGLSLGREHKQEGRDQLEVHSQGLTLIDGKYQLSLLQGKYEKGHIDTLPSPASIILLHNK